MVKMEEKDMHSETETVEEKETNPLTKEEILEMSRKENENGDEMEKQQYKTANAIGFVAGLIAASVIIIVNAVCSEKVPHEILMVIASMQAAQTIYTGVKVRRQRKIYLTIGILEIIGAVFFLVAWILELCGVA